MVKTCLSCNSKLTGRVDKKFCNSSCRNDFHNNRIITDGAIEKLIFSSIKRNRKILQHLVDAGQHSVNLIELERCGFSFNGLTGIAEAVPGKFNYYCFEFMINRSGNHLLIEKIQNR